MDLESNRLYNLMRVKEKIKECLTSKYGVDALENISFLNYHKVILGDSAPSIPLPDVNDVHSIKDLVVYFDAIKLEKEYLKQALELKGINMNGVPFTQYGDKICQELQVAKNTSIYVYNTTNNKNTLYGGHNLYFIIKDENGNFVDIDTNLLSVKFETKNTSKTPTKSNKVYSVTVPGDYSSQYITITFNGITNKYQKSTRRIYTTVTNTPKEVTYSASGFKNSESCPEKKDGQYTKWSSWVKLSASKFSVGDSTKDTTNCRNYTIAGNNGTHHTPGYLECYFKDMETFCGKNVKQIKNVTLTFYDAVFPTDPSYSLSSCPTIPAATAKLRLTGTSKEVSARPTRNGSKTKDYHSHTLSWSGLSKAGSSFVSDSNTHTYPVLISWGKNENTNPGELRVKDVKLKIGYIPNQETVTLNSKFN